jgi:succinate dehydrogenase / fumarate reductase membrane anchor subunit
MKPSAKQRYRGQIWSAILLMLALPYLILRVYFGQFEQLNALISFLRDPTIFIPGFITLALILLHSWVGLRDIFIDYLPRTSLHFALNALALSLLLLAAWLLLLTLRLFGADYGV